VKIKNVAMIGMGAIGTVYGSFLYKRYGSDFAVIAGEKRNIELKSEGITLNNNTLYPLVLSPDKKDIKYDLIIFCVKNYQLDKAIDDVRNFVGENTIILTILNGITARDRILSAYPDNKVLYGLSTHMNAVRTPEGVFSTEHGEIQFGDGDNTVIAPEVQAVQELLNEAGIKNKVFPDMIRAMWKKFMLNVGVNQVTAITKASYEKVASVKTNLILYKEAMMEVLKVAQASGVDLREKDVEELMASITSRLSAKEKTSMLQDVEAKRKTEVDYFSGLVVEMGKKLSIPTPVNHVLYCLIKSIEELY